MNQPRRLRWVLYGGLLAGTLDMLYACLFWAVKAGVSPLRIFQSVAAGLLGKASFQGGVGTAALGLGLHYFIATSMSATYSGVATFWAPLRERPVLLGGLYGLFLYSVMNCVVVPLSAASPGSRDPLWIGLSVVVHVVLIGIPIALCARRGWAVGR